MLLGGVLREVLLEETPLQSLIGHLHTVAVICLAVALSIQITPDLGLLFDAHALVAPLATTGGLLLLFYVSAWFWRRGETLRENQALLKRW